MLLLKSFFYTKPCINTKLHTQKTKSYLPIKVLVTLLSPR